MHWKNTSLGINGYIEKGKVMITRQGAIEALYKVIDSGILSEALEMVRWAPSAVNKQPWRVVVDGNKVHFYEKKAKGYVNPEGWDLQKVDLGIALCHFHCGLEDRQINAEFVIADPGIQKPQDVEYIASYVLQES